jgi:hypothetical protein
MRIAVCFIGMIRTGIESSESLKHWFGSLYNDIDFYMHTWDVSESKLWHHESRFVIDRVRQQNFYRESSYPLIEQLENIYDKKFISIEVENQERFLSSNFYQRYHSFSPQWYSWHKVMQLVDAHEKLNNFQYDIVVKIRPDIIFPKERNLREEILNFFSNTSALYTLGYNPVRIDDVMFLSSSRTMHKASKFMPSTDKKVWETNILGEWLEKNGIKALNTAHTVYSIYRKEHVELGVSPMKFNRCVNVDRDFYAPYNVDRLHEDDE